MTQIDNFNSDYFLWVTATGIPAARVPLGPGHVVEPSMLNDDTDEEKVVEDGQGGEG